MARLLGFIQKVFTIRLKGTSKKNSLISYYYRFLQFCQPWIKYSIVAIVFTIIIAGLQLPLPLLTKYAIDTIFPNGDVSMLNLLVIGLLALMLGKEILNYSSNLLIYIFRQKVVMAMQLALLRNILNLKMPSIINRSHGTLINRLLSDCPKLKELMADTVLNFLKNILTFIFGIVILMNLHVTLSVFAISLVPFVILSTVYFSTRLRKLSVETQQKWDYVCNHFLEVLDCLPIIKSYCQEEAKWQEAANYLSDQRTVERKLHSVSLQYNAISSVITMIGLIGVWWIGGHEILAGRLSLGGFVAFMAFLYYLYGPVQSIIRINASMQSAFVSIGRVYKILDSPKEDSYTSSHVKSIKNLIKYENVTFSYDETRVLKNVSFDIKRNEHVFIIGTSGVGKTTILNLLLKFYIPQSGRIFIDGKNIQKINTYSLRKCIGVVFQKSPMFARSIKENVLFANRNATDADLKEALKTADLYEKVDSLPNGYDTIIGPNGIRLSGGEQQKLAIARVILKDPDVLFFDEAMSEIDFISEKRIYATIKKVCYNKIIISITHRINVIEPTCKVILMEKGAVKAIGYHEELFRTHQSYRCLYNLHNQYLAQTKIADNIHERIETFEVK